MSQSDNFSLAWGIGKKTAFRFFFIFILVTLIPFPVTEFKFLDSVVGVYQKCLDTLVMCIGTHLLNLKTEISVEANGSGDRTYDYIFLLLTLILAAIGSLVWSFIDSKRDNYNLLLSVLRIYIRYYLAFTLITYGFEKIFLNQFPPVSPDQLFETYGQSSPMGLLWTFMSHSPGYNLFTGLAEVLGGSFLLFRRTSLLGAMITGAVMCNVVALDFCYDVPAKIYSCELLLLAVFLVLQDGRRLIQFFLLNKMAQSASLNEYFSNSNMNKAKWGLKFLVIGYVLYITVSESYASHFESRIDTASFSIYEVETFVVNKDTLLPLTTDSIRWSKFMINGTGSGTIELMTGRRKYYSYLKDTTTQLVTLNSFENEDDKFSFRYNEIDSAHLIYSGKLNNDSVTVLMKKANLHELPLNKRGFHWVNEFPRNF